MTLAICILAAGSSSRMRGRDKLLEPVDGEPLLTRQTRRALATGHSVYVALPAVSDQRDVVLRGLDVRIVRVGEEAPALSVSIRALMDALPDDVSGALLALSDMPDIDVHDLQRLVDEARSHPDDVVRAATASGRPGHPVVFPRRLFPDLRRLSGDQGARDFLKREEVRLVRLEGDRASVDLDTPEEWALWRSTRQDR